MDKMNTNKEPPMADDFDEPTRRIPVETTDDLAAAYWAARDERAAAILVGRAG